MPGAGSPKRKLTRLYLTCKLPRWILAVYALWHHALGAACTSYALHADTKLGLCCLHVRDVPLLVRRDKNDLLNETTAVFEYWQEDPKHSLDEARSAFQSSIFIGS